jgi:hypothetical protein
MITLEQVDKLREKADVSYDEAKAALEATGGDILEALINLEKQGKVAAPEGGGFYSSAKEKAKSNEAVKSAKGNGQGKGESVKDLIRKFINFCAKIIHKGNINSFEVLKGDEVKTSFSITLLVLLLIPFFWVTIPLIVIGLFLGYRYRFNGPDLGKDSVNNAMNSAANAAEVLKKSFVEGNDRPKE